jgi:hypothetical protein
MIGLEIAAPYTGEDDVSLRYISLHGSYPQNLLIFGTALGISSSNIYAHISAQKKPIICLMAQNAYLGEIHKEQSEKVGYRV